MLQVLIVEVCAGHRGDGVVPVHFVNRILIFFLIFTFLTQVLMERLNFVEAHLAGDYASEAGEGDGGARAIHSAGG
jgi:hypothetical protein